MVHFGKLDDERLTSTILSMAGAVGPGALLQEKAIIESPDSCRHLPNITCPTLASFSPLALTPLHMHREIAYLIPSSG